MTWKITNNKGQCSVCSHEFAEEEDYISNIIEDEEGFARKDMCSNCWDDIEAKDSFYFWKARYRTNRKKNIFVDDATLMNFFTRLEEENSEMKINFRYLLSLILMRKKLLIFKDIFKEGSSEYMVVRNKEGQDFQVLNPGMDKETIMTVKEQMIAILDEDMFGDEEDGE